MYKNLNAAGLEPAPPGNRPGALTALKPCQFSTSYVEIFIRLLKLIYVVSDNN